MLNANQPNAKSYSKTKALSPGLLPSDPVFEAFLQRQGQQKTDQGSAGCEQAGTQEIFRCDGSAEPGKTATQGDEQGGSVIRKGCCHGYLLLSRLWEMPLFPPLPVPLTG